MRAKIAAIPDGIYRNNIQVEGIDSALTLQCAVTISGSDVLIDLEGTSPSVLRAINVNKLTSAGCVFKFWVADWFAMLNQVDAWPPH